MDVQEQAQKALEILRKKGWTQGRLYSDRGSVCLMGAVNLTTNTGRADVIPSIVEIEDIVNALQKVIKEQYPELYGNWDSVLISIPSWNDNTERTQAEVEAILEKVANS